MADERPTSKVEPAREPTSQAWWMAVPFGLAAIIGVSLGSRFAFEFSGPDQGDPFASGLPVLLVSIAVVGGTYLVALLLLVLSGTRAAGKVVLLVAVGLTVGWGTGGLFGPRWQPSRDLEGIIELRLDAPEALLVGHATCQTLPNSDVVASIRSSSLGSVGIDRIGVRLDRVGSVSSIQILVNGESGYGGRLHSRSTDSATGNGSFEDTVSGPSRLGGTGGPAALSGAVSWRCDPEARAPDRTDSIPVGPPLQGLFRLGGIAGPDPCFGVGPCQTTSQAQGTCSAALDLKVERITTVVPWIDGTRARLDLMPDRETATLTVTVDDGSPAETITAEAHLVERRPESGGEIVLDRTLIADFALQAGRLPVSVEWICRL